MDQDDHGYGRWRQSRPLAHKATAIPTLTRDLSSPFLQAPSIYGSLLRTRILVSLAINGPARPRDLFRVGAGAENLNTVSITLNRLRELGFVGHNGRRSRATLWFLNPAHPAHAEFVALAQAVHRQWPVPPWDPKAVQAEELARCTLPETFECTWFGYEVRTRILLFVAAAGQAHQREIADMLGGDLRSFRDSIKSLLLDGLLALSERPHENGAKYYEVNSNYFAFAELHALLIKLLEIHPDIPVLVSSMQQYRFSRRLKVNRGRPHIKGLSKSQKPR